MKNVSECELAYFAGFFDGEGHIRISTHSKRCRTMMLKVSANQVTKYPLDSLHEYFGGSLNLRYKKQKDVIFHIYEWQASSMAAEKFLRAILPYLIAKKGEAELAIKFRETFRPQHVEQKEQYVRMDDNILEFRKELQYGLKNLRKAKKSIINQ